MIDPAEAGFCRAASLASDVPLAATATADTDVWLVLEYRGAWAAKAWEAAEMPAAVREHVDGFMAAHGRARVQLVRRAESRDRTAPVLVLGSSRPGATALARFRLGAYDDLRGIDLATAIVELREGETPAGAELVAGPMLLVCTNGKRDRCCAKWGLPIYEALRRRTDVDVWQTSHVGGHRFAPTLLWLPDGACFGRVELGDAARLVDGLVQRSIVGLAWFRGRTYLSEAGQAIEHAVRLGSGSLGLDDIEIEEIIVDGERVRGRARRAGTSWRVELVREERTELAPSSCGKAPQPVNVWRTIACTST